MKAFIAPTSPSEKEGELHFHVSDILAVERCHNAYPTGFILHLKHEKSFCLTEDSFTEVKEAFTKHLGES